MHAYWPIDVGRMSTHELLELVQNSDVIRKRAELRREKLHWIGDRVLLNNVWGRNIEFTQVFVRVSPSSLVVDAKSLGARL